MRYLGGKFKIKKDLHDFFNVVAKDKPFYDLLCGACNVVEGVTTASYRVANDNNPYLIEMFKGLVNGWMPPSYLSEDEYKELKNTKPLKPITAFAGIGCSYGGKWFDGYAKEGGRNFASNCKNSLLAQKKYLRGVKFINNSYDDVLIEDGSIVYCDIPYRNTTSGYYTNNFNHDSFYRWVHDNKQRLFIYISEYKHNVPDDFTIVLEKKSKRALNNSIDTTEVLITPKEVV